MEKVKGTYRSPSTCEVHGGVVSSCQLPLGLPLDLPRPSLSGGTWEVEILRVDDHLVGGTTDLHRASRTCALFNILNPLSLCHCRMSDNRIDRPR